MPVSFDGKLVVAISSRALFDLEESNRVFEEEGVEAYHRYQLARENEVLAPGIALPLVKKLLALNARAPARPRVEVILLSRNTAETGLRIMNSIQHYGFDITRAAFTGGESTFPYVPAFDAHLFLSANGDDVRRALDAGHAAAQILPVELRAERRSRPTSCGSRSTATPCSSPTRPSACTSRTASTRSPRPRSKRRRSRSPADRSRTSSRRCIASSRSTRPTRSPLRTALVTARSAPAHERVVRTLRAWGIRIDEALFLGGLDKGPFLKAFGADIFFDDQHSHVESARKYVAAGHVPFGVANE